MAMASSNVDLPDPFSPTKQTTGASRAMDVIPAMDGTVNGNRARCASAGAK